MKLEVISMWVEMNLRSIVEEGQKHLQFSAADGYFKKAALEAAGEIVTSPSMIIFKQRFWPRYRAKLKENRQPNPMISFSEEEGNPTAIIISYEEVPVADETKEKAA